MKYLLIIASLFLASNAFAAETKEKDDCIACVTAAQRASVQKKLDTLRARVKELEAENEALKARPVPTAVRTTERVVETIKVRPHTFYGLAGVMPDGIHVDRSVRSAEAEVHEYGFGLGAGYMYNFESGLNLGVAGMVTTRDTHLQAYWLTAGKSFMGW